ncbi:unnamed protein product (macronuclear) [Paramecium tetraurelia]|uniref:Uncharacterized protein n=1 Tax=Paramecium tetraurelia TaxID=5888 RepID=A0CIT4_PARTE|nr:uncharacterized protein GSPATT00007836001 [Paramecium tetraurelia]CAK70701.1 unnamed protein product [Paramecium tetraurelia]|eukprot:XP_001438098.1 hypothetical protein (macronuclear) [Paramecium tetraurelia strain d4-2]
MNQQNQGPSFLKLNIKEKANNKDTADQIQEIQQIKIIKQYPHNYQQNNDNIKYLQQATSQLYYAMFQIKDKSNLQMIPFAQEKFDEQNWLYKAIMNIIKEKQQFLDELKDEEKNKYKQAISWTEKILDQQAAFDEFYLQILEVYKQIKRPQNNNLLVLQQNQNKDCNKFLYPFCFIQNLNLEQNLQQSIQELDDRGIINQSSIQSENFQKKNLFLSVASDIQQIDINFWTFYLKDYKETNKLIILNPITSVEQLNNNISNSGEVKQNNTSQEKLKNNTRNEIIVPIIYKDPVSDNQMKIIYNSILDSQIKNFKPDCIYLEFQISNDFKLDFPALEYLIRKLQRNARLTIHFRISLDKNVSEQDLSLYLNAIIMGLQGFRHPERKFINDNDYKGLVDWTSKMTKLKDYQNKNTKQSFQTTLQQIQTCLQNTQEKNFGIIQGKDEFKWLQKDNCNINSQHLVFEKNIVVYDKTQNKIWYSSYSPNLMNDNSEGVPLKLQFQVIGDDDHENPIEPSIIELKNHLIIAYGHTQNDKHFSDKIWRCDLQNKDYRPIEMNRNEEYQQFRHTYYQKFKDSNEIVNKIKWRRAPQICKNNLFQDNENFLSFLLIGGETLVQEKDGQSNPNLIMNIIEVVILNLQDNKFCSFILNKQSQGKFSSLKPWPYQTVLEGKLNNACFYLILNGNQNMRKNYYSFPKNPQYLKQVQLIVQSESSFQLFFPYIKFTEDLIIQIDELIDDCKVQYFDEESSGENCFVWKLLITRYVFNEFSLPNHPLFKKFEEKLKKMQQQSIQHCLVCFQVSVKLKLQVSEQNPQNYQDSIVEIEYEKIEVLQQNNNNN